jgi:hypothetical protein
MLITSDIYYLYHFNEYQEHVEYIYIYILYIYIYIYAHIYIYIYMHIEILFPKQLPQKKVLPGISFSLIYETNERKTLFVSRCEFIAGPSVFSVHNELYFQSLSDLRFIIHL